MKSEVWSVPTAAVAAGVALLLTVGFGAEPPGAGPVGGGDETARWQAAIDAAAARGGGRVTIPGGRHPVGQLNLRSNVELHLAEGAVLDGLVGLEHYQVTELPYSEGTWSAVVSAIGVTNVQVTGRGEVRGNGDKWWLPPPVKHKGCQEGRRARGLFFADCTDVRLEDFTLRDAACWGVVLKRCERVRVLRLTIDSHANINNDGLDIEARDVVIADCRIDASDDAVCIKSNDPGYVVENILVTNVTALSHCNSLKLGTASHGTMRNIRFVDCRTGSGTRDFRDWRPGRDGCWWAAKPARSDSFPGSTPGCARALSAIVVENVDGGVVEDISFERIAVAGAYVPIFIRGGRRRSRACKIPPSDRCIFRNVRLAQIAGSAESAVASSITGVEACRVKGVSLRDVRIVCRGGGETGAERTRPVPEKEGAYPEANMFGGCLPAYGLYVRHVDGLRLEGVEFPLAPGTYDRRQPVVLDDVTDVTVAP
ncbi:MAG: glycoside hydrolase family 28 protein [Kiritimatiellia bacterium]